MNRKSRKKVENENEEEDDGPERAQIRAELEDNEQLLEEKSAGGSQSIVTKKKKKKKIRKITNEEAQLSSELTNLEAQLK